MKTIDAKDCEQQITLSDESVPISSASKSSLFLKRLLDIIGSSIGLLLLSPLICVLALLVRAKLGAPILFRQRRPGRFAQPFTVLKFRTMVQALDSQNKLLPDAARLTQFGSWLRNCSLDELPQLWNVLRGEMSLVGPRPLLMQYLERYTPEQAKRHLMKPGITGWAQIGGRNAITWEQRFSLDVWYVEHWSLALDFRMILQTIFHLRKRDGISQAGHATMPEFMGTPKHP